MHTEPLSSAEKRFRPRRLASGRVLLSRSNAPGESFSGRLEDVSSSGFRIRHHCFSLAAGELVTFELEGRRGLARSVWTRILGDRVETGFWICEETPLKAERGTR